MAPDSREKKKGIGDLLDTLNGLLDLANSLSERGEEGINRTGEFKTDSGVAARYGVHLRTGIPANSSIPKRRADGGAGSQPPAQAARPEAVQERPPVDVISNGEQVTVIAEIPGVSEQSIDIEVQGENLVLAASKKGSRLEQTVKLPFEVSPEPVSRSYNNGIFSLVLRRAA